MANLSETKTVKTAHGDLRYHLNWDNDGSVEMENPQTIKLYIKMKDEHPDSKECGVFFAFNNQQFEEGRQELIQNGKIKEGDKICSFPDVNGMFGTKDGITKFLNFYDDREKRISEVCDPQEVYFYEYNNFECMISWDGDEDAYRIVEQTFGKEAAKKVQRIGY